MYISLFKPFLDRVFAFVLLILLSPCWMLVMMMVSASQGLPLFFCQKRAGLAMQPFSLYKIRTLEQSYNSSDLSLENRSYTSLGKWLRRTGLDEFPQLVNVLKGQMSFVGPRPLPVTYNDQFLDWHKKRFRCLPGITGWAQVNGRNDISWEKRFQFDSWYVDHISFMLDAKILWKSLVLLSKRKSLSEMPVFTGSEL